tara:strand:+ start:1917 stop:2144 length:228 start_codon:yes stop_codon:yes gene_type:complete
MIDSLKARWKQKTGEEMPDDIASLTVRQIMRAVELTELGITVVIPKEPSNVAADDSVSMADWDRQDEKNGNAYGS